MRLAILAAVNPRRHENFGVEAVEVAEEPEEGAEDCGVVAGDATLSVWLGPVTSAQEGDKRQSARATVQVRRPDCSPTWTLKYESLALASTPYP